MVLPSVLFLTLDVTQIVKTKFFQTVYSNRKKHNHATQLYPAKPTVITLKTAKHSAQQKRNELGWFSNFF